MTRATHPLLPLLALVPLLGCGTAMPSGPREAAGGARRDRRVTLAHTAASLGHLCQHGDPPACYRVGARAESAHDGPAALRAFQRGCSRRHAPSCLRLGSMHLEGRGVAPHEGRGVYFLKESCALGAAAACVRLAAVYDDETRRQWHNPDRAYQWLRRACDVGDRSACARARERRETTPLQTLSGQRIRAEGLAFVELTCALQTRGALALIEVVSTLESQRPPIAACGPPGAVADIHWTWQDGRTTRFSASGMAGCLAPAFRAARPLMNGECHGTLAVGGLPVRRPTARGRRRH